MTLAEYASLAPEQRGELLATMCPKADRFVSRHLSLEAEYGIPSAEDIDRWNRGVHVEDHVERWCSRLRAIGVR